MSGHEIVTILTYIFVCVNLGLTIGFSLLRSKR